MSAKTREYDAAVARVITDAGGQLLERGMDGSGHRMVRLRHHDQERTFHYAATGTSRGTGLRNMKQRLKWLLAGIPPAPPRPANVEQFVETPPAIVVQPAPRQPTPPSSKRLTKARRSAIIKRYLNPTVTAAMIEAEFDLSNKTVEILLMATAGAVRTKYERERHKLRCEDNRARRKPAEEPLRPSYNLNLRDYQRIGLLRFYGVPTRDLASMYGITPGYVSNIAGRFRP